MVISQQDKLGRYNQVGITTSNQEMLILKCYNGILGCLRTAKELMPDAKKREQVNNSMVKAQKGVGLLAGAVNTDDGSEIGANLVQLYDFLIRYLVEANIKKNTDMIDEAIEIISDLKISWEKAFKKMHEQGLNAEMSTAPVRQSVLNIVG